LEVDRVLAKLAEGQLGLIHDHEALAVGVSPAQIRRRVRVGTLERVMPNVTRVAAVEATWEQRQLALCKWAGPGWVSSRTAAGAIYGFDGLVGIRHEISGAGRISRTPTGVYVHERCVFLPGDQANSQGIPVTSPARTVIDLSADLDHKHLERAFESAIRMGYITPEFLMRRLRKLGTKGRRRARRIIEVLVDRGDAPPSDSDFEILIKQVLRDGDLPLPEMQVPVHDDQGFIARVDFIYPLLKLILEADSYKHHAGREDWATDGAKRRRITALGYSIMPITYRDVMTDRRAVQGSVRRAIATRSP
jgi:very-short-patch-repair endonuclease